ncbi:MAG: TlpA family protein disulfide reductase [Magnetospirillum sp.]|nr:MAG: TlpA family protein disulfide reductase [Magnetospirillum sp.]
MRRFVLAAMALMLAGPAGAGELRPFVQGSYAALVKEHAGRPLVIHFWSLTCAPCLVELPQWREAQRHHPEMDLVLVATDSPDEAPKLGRTLTRAGLTGVDSWVFADSFAERLRFEVDKTWHGELPMTRLVGRDGAAEAVTGTVSDAALAAWLARQPGGKP